MEHDVFISFAFKDEDTAKKIYWHLKKNGINCFWCNDLPGGAKYGQELGKAIIGSEIFLLLLSSSADASDSVYQEVMIAHNNKIKKIPARLENISPVNLAYAVAGNLYFDLFTKPLEQRLPELIADIKKQLPYIPIKLPSKPIPQIKDDKWHDTDYGQLSQWVKDRINVLTSGKTLTGRTFLYRLNRNTGKYQRKLRISK
jgi:hypothetical protein